MVHAEILAMILMHVRLSRLEQSGRLNANTLLLDPTVRQAVHDVG